MKIKVNNLPVYTDEQRAEMRLKAQQSIKDRIAYAEKHLKVDYMEMPTWEKMARDLDIRLPNKTAPSTETKYIRRLATKLNVETKDFLDSVGATTLVEFSDLNPTWTARAYCGLFLEYVLYDSGKYDNVGYSS